jgi:LPS O-antigen subunit length determinant protein (WzzB/FepE family)
MIEENFKNNLPYDDDNIDIRELLRSVLDRKLSFVSITLSFAIFSVLYSLSLTNIYTSEAILMPSEDARGSRSSGGYGEIASMVGLSSTSSSVSKTDKGIKELESFIFFKNIIESNDILPKLFASKTYDKKNKILEYDQEIYDAKKSSWMGHDKKPSDQQAFRVFKSIFEVEKDKEGFIVISISHMSPYFAKDLLDIIIESINEQSRQKDKIDAEESIKYLTEELIKTNLYEIKQVLSRLIENQIQSLVLTEVRKEYLFKVIEPPIVPEIKSFPNRALICIVITILGSILSFLICIYLHFRKKHSS